MSLAALIEGYGRVYSFNYLNPHRDPNPKTLWLGKWRNPDTGNVLIGSINLNALSPDELVMLRKNLPQLLADRNLKRRYWTGRALLPDIFKKAYRTYDQKLVGSVTKGTLTAIQPTDADNEAALKLAQDDGHAIDSLDELPEDKQLEYINKAVIDRALASTPAKGKKRAPPTRDGQVAQTQPAQQERTDAEATMTPPVQPTPPSTTSPPPPPIMGMQPMTPDSALPPGTVPPPPPPPPQPHSGPDEFGAAPPAPKGPPPMPPTSPARRRAPEGKKEPGREAPQAPQAGHPTLPTDLTSPGRRGAAGAVKRLQQREFGKELDKKQEGGPGAPPTG